MNILILDSWLRDYLKTNATPQEIAKYLSLCGPSVERLIKEGSDWIYDIEVTTNRVDLMSIVGIAREAAAILPQFNFKATFDNKIIEESKIPPNSTSKHLPLTIEDPKDSCIRIMAVVLDNVTLQNSPEIVKKRLNAGGIRSINNAVDITNYIMLELGQPTHVFDYDAVTTQKLIFRRAKKGEKVVSLDAKSHSLPGDDIVIDDGTGKIIDLPGIIGTANSVVTPQTKRVIFFIDNPDPRQLRKTSMTLGIRTMAATINEKGVDTTLAKTALLRGAQLFAELTGSKVASKIYDHYPSPPAKKAINISDKHIQKIIGVEIPRDKIIKILNSLGFETTIKADNLQVTIPSFRVSDISIPEDIIEEIARIYGYHNLPSILPAGRLPQRPVKVQKQFTIESKIKNLLSGWGYTETYTYSMQSLLELQNARLSKNDHLKIANPLTEEWVYLRTSITASLLPVIKNNQSQVSDMKLFELSTVYLPQKNANLPVERIMLVIAETGTGKLAAVKGTTEELLSQLGIKNIEYNYQSTESPLWKKGRSGAVLVGDRKLAVFGEISTSLLRDQAIKTPVSLCEIDITVLMNFATLIKTYKPVSLFTPITEDFSFSFANPPQIGPLITALQAIDPKIETVQLLDRYEKNAAFRITFQDLEKQLASSDLRPLRHKINKIVSEHFAGKLIGKI